MSKEGADVSLIEENLKRVEENISLAAQKSGRSRKDITLIAVTKTHPVSMIREAAALGVTDAGENKVQELRDKFAQVPGVDWHMIGHLQSNKVKYIIDKVKLIHSVDSISLMDEIERQASKHQKEIEVLIQVNVSGEQTKFGIHPNEISRYLEHVGALSRVKIAGLMTIAPKTDHPDENRLHFDNIYARYLDIKTKTYDNVSMKYLSMGMSGDYTIAIESGSNMVRVGSAIFGARNYN